MNNGVSNNKVYVVGHKNPDTDSICSAIAYANLKSKITGEDYSPRRAGQLNEETQYVLDHFQVEAPKLLSDLRVQVKDVELRNIEGIKGSVSIKSAWKSMKELNIKTLPVTRDSKLEGLITIGDIATSYMDVITLDALDRDALFCVVFETSLVVFCSSPNTLLPTILVVRNVALETTPNSNAHPVTTTAFGIFFFGFS